MTPYTIGLTRRVSAAVVKSGIQRVFVNRIRRAGPRVRHLVIASPWITSRREHPQALQALADLISKRGIATYVFTRPPENSDQVEALLLLQSCPTVELVYNANLHAKIYACVAAAPFGFAILGSANMTTHSESLYEIGLLVTGVGGGEAIVKELAGFGLDYVRTRAESRVIKRIDVRRINRGL